MTDKGKVIDCFQAALRMKNEHGFCILPFEPVEDALKLLKAQEPGWISVRDRLPEESGRYLVYAKEGERETHRTIAPFQKAFHLSGRMAYWRVTHWMPLPEPPKEGT